MAGFQKVTSIRKYRIVRARDEAVLAVAETNWAFVSLQTRQPRRIPPELIAAFEIADVAAARQ